MGAARKYASALARYRLPDNGTLDAQRGAVRRGVGQEHAMGAARKYATALARYRLPDNGTLDAQWGAFRRGIG